MSSSLDKLALGRARLAARRERITLIRRRVAAFSALFFALLWTILFGQLVIGRDPALAGKHHAKRVVHRSSRARRTAVTDLGAVRPPHRRHQRNHHRAAAPAPQAPAQAPAPTPVTTSQS
jgi:hypothetical protein